MPEAVAPVAPGDFVNIRFERMPGEIAFPAPAVRIEIAQLIIGIGAFARHAPRGDFAFHDLQTAAHHGQTADCRGALARVFNLQPARERRRAIQKRMDANADGLVRAVERNDRVRALFLIMLLKALKRQAAVTALAVYVQRKRLRLGETGYIQPRWEIREHIERIARRVPAPRRKQAIREGLLIDRHMCAI